MRISTIGLTIIAVWLSLYRDTRIGGKDAGLEGIWKPEGYGYVFQVDGRQLKAFEVTAVSCIPVWRSTRLEHAPAIPETPAWVESLPIRKENVDNNSGWFSGGFADGDTLFRIVPTSDSKVRILQQNETYNEYILHRMAALPQPCTQTVENTPLGNYDVFWATFAENYPYFHLHNLDWNAVNAKFRSRVNSHTAPHELFSIFKEMLAPLHDAHVLLQAFPPNASLIKAWERTDAVEEFWEHKSDPEPLEDADFDAAAKLIDAKYITGKTQYFCNHKIAFGMIKESIGYLGITSFHDYTADDDFGKGLQELTSAANKIFQQTGKLQGLVIDIRANHGGDDPYEMTIASHLTTVPYLAFSVKARKSGSDATSFTTPEHVFVRPAVGPHFLGKVILLTGRDTASAGEGFALSLMGRAPTVIRVGENTQGTFSEELDRRLPNGWRVVLPNEVDLSPDGRSFHGDGIPPDVRVPGFRKQDIADGRDVTLERALQLLTQGVPRPGHAR